MKPRIIQLRKQHALAASSLYNRVSDCRDDGQISRYIKEVLVDPPKKGETTRVFAAVAGKTMQGVVVVLTYDKETGGEIDYLFVDASVRRQGIGTALIKKAEDFIAHNWIKEGTGEVTLADLSYRVNDPANTYYQRMGYEVYLQHIEREACSHPDACEHKVHQTFGGRVLGNRYLRDFSKTLHRGSGW